MRDVYTHAYHRVDFDLMWEQLVTQLSSLRQALGRIDPDELEEAGAVARTWLSIRVDLVEGMHAPELWPRPGRILLAGVPHRSPLSAGAGGGIWSVGPPSTLLPAACLAHDREATRPKGWERMAEITVEESWRQIQALIGRAERAAEEQRWDDAVAHWRQVLGHPCAHHQVMADEILDEVHQTWRRAGRYDEAIAAKREAIAAGYRSVPAPEADIAECLLAAGRRDEAEALFAELRQRDPDDVWLYNSAAYSYADAGEMRTSLRWALDGIDVALATGDPDQVVMQLLECAEAAWTALEEPADDELVERVETFCDQWTPVPSHRRWGDAPAHEDRPCAHCGYQPETSGAEQDERIRRARRQILEAQAPEALARLDAAFGEPEPQARLSGPVELAIGWFPADQWPGAVDRWPHLLDDLPADHGAYTQATEARIKRIARHVHGNRLHVAPMTVDGLVAHAENGGDDPGTGAARSAYAATLLGQGHAVIWPPGRNDHCWCGSGRKYKKCCGPIPHAPDEPA